MPQVIVRKLPDGVIEGLKARAVAAGHSLEQELRLILIAAGDPPLARLRDLAAAMRARLAGERPVDSLSLLVPGRHG